MGSVMLLGAILLSWVVLDVCRRSEAAAEAARQPFRNAVGQRKAIIQELREIRQLLEEQNALPRSAEKKGKPAKAANSMDE
jgi:hypothetical protein